MIDLLTLGSAAAHRDGEPLPGLLTHPDAFALLARLSIDGPASRERLAVLWPGEEADREHALEAAVRVIRRAVGAGCIVQDGDVLRCAEGAVRSDAARLEAAAAEEDWVSVDRLYRGPFLAEVPLPDSGWTAWRKATAMRMAGLARRAASEIGARGVQPLDPSAKAPGPPSAMTSRLHRIRGRLVFQVTAVYAAATLTALGALDMLIERGFLAEWVFATALALAAVGFVVVLAAALAKEAEAGLAGGTGAADGPVWVRRARASKLVVALGAVALLFLTGFLILRQTLPANESTEVRPDLRRIAVLYFEDRSPEQNLGHIAAGLTDDIIALLSGVEALTVPSRYAVKPVRDGAMTLDSLIAALDLGAFVGGSVERGKDELRVNVQLVDAASRTQIDSRIVQASTEDPFSLRNRLAEEITHLVRQRLGVEVMRREHGSEASDPEAWILVQRAEQRREVAETFGRTDLAAARRVLEEADSLLALAATLDPRWYMPPVLRGWIAVDRSLLETDLPGNVDPGWARTALAHADEAVDVSREHPAALELRGRVRFGLAEVTTTPESETLYTGAERDLRAAVRADSSRARAWVSLSRLLKRKTQFAEAQEAAKQALRADYYLSEARDVTWELFHTSLEMEELEEADQWCAEGRRRWPAQPRFQLCRLFILASAPRQPRDLEGGWRVLDSMVAITPEAQQPLTERFGTMVLAQIAAQAGLPDSARALIRRSRGGPEPDPSLAYNEAHARVLLGETDLALDLLELHIRDFPSRGGRYLAEDWWFRELRSSQRFRALVESTGDPDLVDRDRSL